jgi:hypothetical protein
MKLNLKMLTAKSACTSGVEWYKINKQPQTVEAAITLLLKSSESERYNWSNWALSQFLSPKNKLRYAIFAAQQVLDIFEKKYPTDNRPRRAIEAALKCLEKNTVKNRSAAWAAARAAGDAAGDAAWAAARAAEDAAGDAAWAAAWDAAWAAARDAGAAGDAAGDAAWAAAWDAGDAACDAMMLKITNYGVALL